MLKLLLISKKIKRKHFVDNRKYFAYDCPMNAKSLRELQQKGGKAIGKEPIVIMNRNGPVGVLIPVNSETLFRIQKEVERMLALESLSQTWQLARKAGLDQMTNEEINAEVSAVRKKAHAQSKRRR